jgi:hypothetical protein
MASEAYTRDDNVSSEADDMSHDLQDSEICNDSEAGDRGYDSDEEDDGATHQNLDVADEATEYLKTLIRNHFATIMEELETPGPLNVE